MEIMVSLSALAPSVYRKYVKGWDKGRYAEAFKRHASGNAYRIYIPIDVKVAGLYEAPPAITSHLQEQGYSIEDYRAGIAVHKDGKRRIRIGKLLSDKPDLKKIFDNDDKRKAYRGQHIICISRHPYDIAGASTARGWTSCMDLHGGSESEYIEQDVAVGSIIAYLIESHDTNINRPVGRVLIKPFIHAGSGEVILRCERKIYGTTVEGFIESVQNWLDLNLHQNKPQGAYRINKDLYDDTGDGAYFHFNPNEKGFWDKVNKLAALKRIDYYTFSYSDERSWLWSSDKNALTKLQVVTKGDVVAVARKFPKDAMLWMHHSRDKMAVKCNSKGEPVKYATREDFVDVLLRIVSYDTKIAGDLNTFDLTSDECISLILRKRMLIDVIDRSKFNVTDFLVSFAKNSGNDLSDFARIAEKFSKEEIEAATPSIVKVKPSYILALPNPPHDVFLRYFKRNLEEHTEEMSFLHVNEELLSKIFPIIAKTNSRSAKQFFSDQLLQSRYGTSEKALREFNTLMVKHKRPNWIDDCDSLPEDISKFSVDFVMELLEHNKMMLESIFNTLEGNGITEVVAAAVEKYPLLIAIHFYGSDLANLIANNKQLGDMLFDSLARNKEDFLESLNNSRGFTPMLFSKLAAVDSKTAINLFAKMVSSFPEIATKPNKLSVWKGNNLLTLIETKALYKYVLSTVPWIFKNIGDRAGYKIPRAKIRQLKTDLMEVASTWKGNAAQKRFINTAINKVSKQIESLEKR